MNRSFRKKMIFRLGYDAGFFSEFNNMILAAVYCAVHGIQFRINSSYANFKFKKGWEDFFLPFFKEERGVYNKKYNYRPYLRKPEPIREGFFKLVSGTKYFTQDLWPLIRDEEFMNNAISIPLLQFNDSLLEACHHFVKMTWRFNVEVEKKIDDFAESMKLPDEYVGIHIRKGDKFNETNIEPNVTDLLNFVGTHTGIRNLYVASDDFSVIPEIRKHSEWTLYYRIPQNARGYLQSDFDLASPAIKFQELLNFFGDIEILNRSTLFIGGISSNVGMYVGMRRNGKGCFYHDAEEWRPS